MTMTMRIIAGLCLFLAATSEEAAALLAPTKLTAVAVSLGEIDLTWQNNAATQTGCRLQRSTNGITFTAFPKLGLVNSYRDTAVLPSSRYWYRVKALTATSASAFSAVASATTPAASTPTPTPSATPGASPVMPGGNFGWTYPNFTGAVGAMTAQQFVQSFSAAMHNPNKFLEWIGNGTDIRLLNPNGAYLKHLNIRNIEFTQREPSAEGHPDYDWIHANHPEWVLHDANGAPIPLFISTEEAVDFGNPAYLDWVFGQWFKHTYSGTKGYLDSTDSDLTKTMWYLHDEGSYLKMNVNCGTNNPVCTQYTTDAGVQTAWKTLFDKFHQYYPNKKILSSTNTLSYMTPSQQLLFLEDVLSHTDGYFSECLTNDHCYWNNQPNADKRNALNATMLLADWCATNNKWFFPGTGMGDGNAPTQAETDYAYAFFNLMRQGDKQIFSQIHKDAGGLWQPVIYPEMNKSLGNPLETRQLLQTDVYRRKFDNAIAYVNISDAQVSIVLPAGVWKNSLGVTVASPLVLNSFSGLTLYLAP